MRIGAFACAVIGHAWHVDESTEIEPLLECSRCGRKMLAPNADSISVRTDVKAGYTRSWIKK